MKKRVIFLAALSAIFALSSCKKDFEPTKTPSFKGEEVTLNVEIGNLTKASATSQANDSKVSNVQLFIFDASGAFETKATSTSTSLSVKCVTGSKKIVALCNAPAVSPANYTALMNSVSSLSDNALGDFVMSGEVSQTVSASNANVTLSVKRLVAKVVIKKITNATTGANASKTFTVKKIYLVNVAANTTYALTSPTEWVNKLSYSSSASDALLYDEVSSGVVANGSSYNVEHDFFPYPNPTENDNQDASWSARHTRLVIEAQLGTEIKYYPVTLPVLERNKTYTINELTIKVPGSTSPDKPIEKDEASFTISVANWETGSNINAEI